MAAGLKLRNRFLTFFLSNIHTKIGKNRQEKQFSNVVVIIGSKFEEDWLRFVSYHQRSDFKKKLR